MATKTHGKKDGQAETQTDQEKMKPVAVSQIIDIAELKPHPQNYRASVSITTSLIGS